MFPLSHVAALSVCQWRIGIDDSILNQISQRKDVALEVESFEPAFGKGESTVLD